MNDVLTKNDEGRPNVDVVLHDYFQAELPHPWPTFRMPRTMRSESSWSRNIGRLALAACIALLVAGYLTLSGFFPRQPASNGTELQPRILGSKEHKGARPTPNIGPMPVPQK